MEHRNRNKRFFTKNAHDAVSYSADYSRSINWPYRGRVLMYEISCVCIIVLQQGEFAAVRATMGTQSLCGIVHQPPSALLWCLHATL